MFCGIDWAERHHDVALVDDTGTLLAKARITDAAAGYHKLLDLLAEHGDSPDDPIPIAIETSHGLLVPSLRTGSRRGFAINPLAASRYRDRHGVSRKKSDPSDALVLANILRTDMHAHRPLPADSELAQVITVLARAQQDAVWTRQQVANQVRSLLREYYPAALLAFQGKQSGLTRADARVILSLAPTPTKAAKLTLAQLRGALKRSGRLRGCDAEARAAAGRLPRRVGPPAPRRRGRLRPPAPGPAQAAGRLREAAEDLAEAATAAFHQHADSEILLSFPGLGPMLGARVLAELGDDRARFADARALKSYAGSAPITRASGKKRFVGRRFVKNNRLINAGFLWAFAALTASPGANAHYRRRREHGDWHAAAQRHLLNRFLGQLHHCLQSRQHFDEQHAFAPLLQAPARPGSPGSGDVSAAV
ncbi:IS110 family transposase [Streptomyces coeruleorubidus]|uniref:IS110 family transposase n=1 Tax=Streptomyces coeruleorubidus TaxID=116188 RepID=UPI0037FA8F50